MEAHKQATLWDAYKYAMKIGVIAGFLLWGILILGGLLPISLRNSLDFLFILALALVTITIGILAANNARPVLPGLIDAGIISGLAGAVAGFAMCVLTIVISMFSNQPDIIIFLVDIIMIIINVIGLGIISAIFGTSYAIILGIITKSSPVR